MIQEGASFDEWNPVHLTKAINKLVGNMKSARVMRNGALMVFCRDTDQQGKAVLLNKIEDSAICYGMKGYLSVEQVKENVEGARVAEAKRLKTTRNGERCDSLSVMIVFDEESLPSKVYTYRLYVLRCQTCSPTSEVL